MKACCRVGEESPPSKGKKILKWGIWLILILIVVGLAIADTMGS